MSRPLPHELCVQVGRWWAADSLLGLSFVEPDGQGDPDSPADGQIFAGTLPRLAHRAALGCSLTLGPQPGATGYNRATPIAIVVQAAAPEVEDALEALNDLRRLCRPREGPFVGAARGGVVGAIALGDEPAWTWRVLAIDVLADAQPLQLGAGDGATEDGQALAQMTIVVHAVPARIARAFDLAGPAGSTAAVAASLTLRDDADTVIALAGQTMTHVFAAAGAVSEWTASDLNTDLSAAAATRLLPIPHTPAEDGVALLALLDEVEA